MAYEVIKRVGGRAYRYRVESFRDPETRRERGRWTYLGRVGDEEAIRPKPPRVPSRDRLIAALERILGREEIERVTSSAVAREAGVAYGTFYRAFRDLDGLVRETLVRYRGVIEPGAVFDAPIGSRADELLRLRRRLDDVLAFVERNAGLTRAWLVVSNRDEAVVAERRVQTAAALAATAAYLRALDRAGVARVREPDFVAYAIVSLLEAVARERALDGAFDARRREGVAAVLHELAGLR